MACPLLSLSCCGSLRGCLAPGSALLSLSTLHLEPSGQSSGSATSLARSPSSPQAATHRHVTWSRMAEPSEPQLRESLLCGAHTETRTWCSAGCSLVAWMWWLTLYNSSRWRPSSLRRGGCPSSTGCGLQASVTGCPSSPHRLWFLHLPTVGSSVAEALPQPLPSPCVPLGAWLTLQALWKAGSPSVGMTHCPPPCCRPAAARLLGSLRSAP